MSGRIFDLELSIQIQEILYVIADICDREKMTQFNFYYELVQEYWKYRPGYQLKNFDDLNQIYQEISKIIFDMCLIRRISLAEFKKELRNL